LKSVLITWSRFVLGALLLFCVYMEALFLYFCVLEPILWGGIARGDLAFGWMGAAILALLITTLLFLYRLTYSWARPTLERAEQRKISSEPRRGDSANSKSEGD